MALKDFGLDDWYQKNYSSINASANPNSIAFKYMHESMEKAFKSNHGLEILEIGANTGEHLNFVSQDFKSYVLTDIHPTYSINFETPNVKFFIADVESLPFADASFDRVISTCVFLHVNNPTQGLKEIRRVVRVGGRITLLLPNDPGIVYRLLRGLTTLRAAKKVGLMNEVQLVHAIEHRNHYLSIKTLIKWVFAKDKIRLKFKPFWFPSYNLNAFTLIDILRME